MTAAAPHEGDISLRLRTLGQLFHTLDPAPFYDKDLDGEAEEYIVGWARELDEDVPLSISVHVPAVEAANPLAADLPHALASNFDYRARQSDRELKELFREGWRALAVGMPLLAACLFGSRWITERWPDATAAHTLGESLLMLAWVANWRPIEIFFYDWWPILRRRRLFRRLATAPVRVAPLPAQGD